MMQHPRLTFPEGIDTTVFLRDYWQKRPLLMPAALPATDFRLSPDELAGLACENEIESRLIIEHAHSDWEVRHGPFDIDDFATLPESHWTLLVQDVDKYLPQVARLLDAFGFMPAWRIDDIMISFAADQGGVGPHTDAYDVFLMQASGCRKWRLSDRSYSEEDLLPDLEQRILANFESDQEWLLQPGDILYLPPGIAHWGVAEGECMTYSLGFRAPSQQELAADWFQHLVSLCGNQRLMDPPFRPGDAPAQLGEAIQQRAADLLGALPDSGSSEFRRWLGGYLTEPKPQFQIAGAEHEWRRADLLELLQKGRGLQRHPFARMAWAPAEADMLSLYCQGEPIDLPGELCDLLTYLTGHRHLDAARLRQLADGSTAAIELLLQLLNEGILEVSDDNP